MYELTFWLRWVCVALRGFLPLRRVECYALAAVHRFLSCGASSGCGAQAQACRLQQLWLPGSRAQAQQLWPMDFVAPRHRESSQTRGGAHVPCIGRWILNHCTTREVLFFFFILNLYSVVYVSRAFIIFLSILFPNLLQFVYRKVTVTTGRNVN